MFRILLCAVMFVSAVADARPTAKSLPMPKVGDTLAIDGADDWPDLAWMYDAPSRPDSAGKVVVHWFCARNITGCSDDLARLIALKESSPGVYIVAYIRGSKYDAKKLDPIRGSEGVGRGTVAFGVRSIQLFRALSITQPVSIVVGVDNKVQLVSTGIEPAGLDARDAKIKALVAAVKLYTSTATAPKTVKAGEKFQLTLTIRLADWLAYSKKPGTILEFKARVPEELTCDHTSLKGTQLQPVNQTLTVQMTCSGPHGSYEAAGQIQFAYDSPGGGTGFGADGARWKFQITE